MTLTETDLGSIMAVLLAVAFFPFSALAAKLVFPTLRPPRHRPFVFFFLGGFLFLFGVLGGYALRPFLQSGVVHFASRHLGEIHADSAGRPLEYWLIIFMLYSLAVLISSVGLSGLCLAFCKKPETQ